MSLMVIPITDELLAAGLADCSGVESESSQPFFIEPMTIRIAPRLVESIGDSFANHRVVDFRVTCDGALPIVTFMSPLGSIGGDPLDLGRDPGDYLSLGLQSDHHARFLDHGSDNGVALLGEHTEVV